jgi:cbb3-type cytochrome oxidase subunit 1
MPALSRWFIKTGMVYLVVGLFLGAVILAQPALGWPPQWQALRPVYLHFVFIGWVTQIIMGVGYWMFPKYSKEQPHGREKLGWAIFGLLNLGLILRAIGEPGMALAPQPVFGWLLAAASLCLLLAGWGFIANTWGRIRAR